MSKDMKVSRPLQYFHALEGLVLKIRAIHTRSKNKIKKKRKKK